jgi:hypothetical protein
MKMIMKSTVRDEIEMEKSKDDHINENSELLFRFYYKNIELKKKNISRPARTFVNKLLHFHLLLKIQGSLCRKNSSDLLTSLFLTLALQIT